MLDQILEELKTSQSFLATHSEILRLISLSGLKRFLEERSRAYVSLKAPTHTVALEGARTAGYTECLLDILYFKERYLVSKTSSKPIMDFGMLDVLESQGDLMPEELHAIRTGTAPIYPKSEQPVAQRDAKSTDTGRGSNS